MRILLTIDLTPLLSFLPGSLRHGAEVSAAQRTVEPAARTARSAGVVAEAAAAAETGVAPSTSAALYASRRAYAPRDVPTSSAEPDDRVGSEGAAPTAAAAHQGASAPTPNATAPASSEPTPPTPPTGPTEVERARRALADLGRWDLRRREAAHEAHIAEHKCHHAEARAATTRMRINPDTGATFDVSSGAELAAASHTVKGEVERWKVHIQMSERMQAGQRWAATSSARYDGSVDRHNHSELQSLLARW